MVCIFYVSHGRGLGGAQHLSPWDQAPSSQNLPPPAHPQQVVTLTAVSQATVKRLLGKNKFWPIWVVLNASVARKQG